jgi:hypothetical protein
MKSTMSTPRFSRIALIILLSAVIAVILIFSRKPKRSALPDLELMTMHSGTGWGYRILVNHHPFLYQPIIPVLSGHHPFPTEAEALKTGSLVIEKLKSGQRPILTRVDLARLGLTADSL